MTRPTDFIQGPCNYLVHRAQLHKVCHINFIEGREHGIGVLSSLESLCNPSSKSCHLHPPTGHLSMSDFGPSDSLITHSNIIQVSEIRNASFGHLIEQSFTSLV